MLDATLLGGFHAVLCAPRYCDTLSAMGAYAPTRMTKNAAVAISFCRVTIAVRYGLRSTRIAAYIPMPTRTKRLELCVSNPSADATPEASSQRILPDSQNRKNPVTATTMNRNTALKCRAFWDQSICQGLSANSRPATRPATGPTRREPPPRIAAAPHTPHTAGSNPRPPRLPGATQTHARGARA